MRFLAAPVAVSLAILIVVFFFGGPAAFFTVALLSVLEVTLSFDNAVVNAQVLKEMTPLWQKRFLTWGMLIAVVGTRLILPVLLVSATALASPIAVAKLAFLDSAAYSLLVSQARFAIDAFGGAFLMMLSLRYFLDEGKTVHWIGSIEKRLSKLSAFESLEIAIVFSALAIFAFFAAPEVRAPILIAGIIGIVISVALEGLMRSLGKAKGSSAHGVGLFIYLNILDSAFSLDGVVGAFALTTAIPLIVIGLGIGAYFVRSLTVYLTAHKVLDSLAFIEHGAYWAIFGLALSMFTNLLVEVPEFVTGGVGLLFLFAAYLSSVRKTGNGILA